MAVSEEFVEQLREVFRVCDVEHKGTISLPHLLTLAGEHFGSSQNSVTSAVAGLGVTGDVITFPQFCEVVATILTSHGNAEEAVSSPVWEEDYLDGAGPSRLQSHVKEAEDDDGRGRERGERRKRGGEGLAEEEEEEEDLSFTPVVGRGGGGGGVGGLGAWRRRRRRKRGVLERRTMPGEYLSSPSPSLSPLTDGDSAIGGSTASPDSSRKTHSMSDREEENFECYGEADDLDADSDSARLGDDLDGNLLSPPHSLPPNNFSRRNSWVRRSLRGPSSSENKILAPRRWASFRHAPKRVGGTAVASQLYRTSSFSSGRSSAADPDDMYSDGSLEEDVNDLSHKVQMLQQQVGVLAENQSNTDDRFSRVRQDNAAYQERVVMLEEQLREAEHRYEERRAEEQRRSRELLTRVEREKQLTVENFTIKLASLEKDKTALEEELRRTKALLEKLQKEKESLEDRVSEAEFTASALHQENAKMVEQGRRRDDEGKVERERSAQVIEELRCEIERLRAAEEAARKRAPSVDASSSPPPELQATLQRLREENKGLVEQVEDLQAQLLTSHLEEGRTLVTATNNNSLAAEFEAMTSEEGNHYGSDTVEKLKKSLKDSQEANQHLRAYIDGILLNIVENYPQLLEVKQPK
ncbi:rab11 family-interacting protein 4B-like isoform X2 [Portunus trituberculatus]|uniref:rab11 family-interacting protein 4B-like isoform X2 n=1 Tax=Portunus trituberculatus TaxID=210409 RepID=UPI001E1CC7BF|nr:rab11 family-interacting protein 4B-like isoform X2 [Portunus trituberculatus]